MTTTTTALSNLNRARRALVAARTVDDVKEIRDQAEALRLYAKQSRLSLELLNEVVEIKVRAERKAGEMLATMERARPADNLKNGPKSHDATSAVTLKELGISKSQSSRWQLQATIPENVFEQRLQELKESGKELTSTAFLSLAKRNLRHSATEPSPNEPITAPRRIPNDNEKCRSSSLTAQWNTFDDDSVDFILVAPSNRQQFDEVAAFAATKLKPGCFCLVHVNKAEIAAVLETMTIHLDYFWTFAICHDEIQQVAARRITSAWHAVLAFGKSPFKLPNSWLPDFIDVRGRSSDAPAPAEIYSQLIHQFTNTGDVIVRINLNGDVMLPNKQTVQAHDHLVALP